jgi:flagellar hook-associated protein 1 FlgK
MPNIGGIFSNAMTGLRAQQTALNVVSHNIANAATEGYSRQKAIIAANPPLFTAEGFFGTGVKVVDVAQIRDVLLDGTFRLEAGDASEQRTRSEMLDRVEAVLSEPTEDGLDGVLDRFLSSWSDLASNPTSASARTVVRQRAEQLVDTMRYMATGIDQIRQDAELRLSVSVDRVNQLTTTIGRMTQEIVAVESSGSTAGDLRDARARALDELSALVPIRVTERGGGGLGVETSGRNIVDGVYTAPLEVGFSGGVAGLQVVGRPGLFAETGGSIGGLLEVVNSDVPLALKSLDDLSAALVADVNALHTTGADPTGATGVDFFDASGVTAWTISLSTQVAASATAIAAGTPDGSGGYRGGANDVALGIAALRDTSLGSLGRTPGEHLRALMSSVGLSSRSAADLADVHETLADQANVRRQSVSSVSVDEELIQLIQFQSAYQASARVISTADEMLRSLLAI